MGSEVWYRKWRPQTFADVAGQKHVTVTLARAVAQNRVAHAYLLCGPRGTGKTSTARILAKAVNCEAHENGQPCTRCDSCVAVTAGRALDLIEMDAASNRGIDEIRSLRDKVGFSPNSSRFKVYLIDEVHELTQFAFDALLKTLEEPPAHVIFILATTEAHRVPETILSRCQRFDFERIKLADIVARLRHICEGENVTAEDGALEVIARRATGSLRDAVNLLEQTVSSQGDLLTEASARAGIGLHGDARSAALAANLLARQLPEALNLVAEVRDDGVDLRQFTRDVVQHLRSLLLARAGAAASLGLGDEALRELQAAADGVPVAQLLRAAQALVHVDFRADPHSPLPLELAVVACIEAPEPEPAPSVQPAVRHERTPAPAAAPASQTAQRLRDRLAPRAQPPAPLRAEPRTVAPQPAPVPPEMLPTAHSSVNGNGHGNPVPFAPPAGDGAAAVEAAAPGGGAEMAPAAVAPAVSQGEPEEKIGVPPPVPEADAIVPPAEPVPAPDGTVAVTPSAHLTLDEARRRFRELYERCREIDRRAAPYLNSPCDIVNFEPGEIVIGMKHPSMLKSMSQQYMPALQRAVLDVYGAGIEVRLVQDDDVINRVEALAAERPSHLLDEALKLGAKPVERG